MSVAEADTPGTETEPSVPGLLDAIAAVHREVGPLPKDSTNPHFGSKFTSLATLIERTDEALARHGLVWTTRPIWLTSAQMPGLYYELTHTPTGEATDGTMPLPGVEHMQGFGSAITYGRRYALTAVLNLVGEEDDDGNTSVPQTRRQAPGTVDLTAEAKGLSSEAINAALKHAGLQPVEKPWGLMFRVPKQYEEKIREGLAAAKAAEGR